MGALEQFGDGLALGKETTMDQSQAKFEGWAVVELFGHQREIGFVTTEYFGGTALFRIDVPELAEREYTLERVEWIDGKLAPAGTVVKRSAVDGRSRLVGPGAVYALNPCSEAAARKAIESTVRRDLAIISLPEGKQLVAPDEELPEEEYDEGDDNEEIRAI